MADEPVFIFLATYSEEASAREDLEAVRTLHARGSVGTYDAAVLTKDDEGKVHVDKWEKPTQHGAWTGIAVGAVVGILFPPSIIAGAAVGGVAGGVIGHWNGMSRKDMKELGELLDEGTAALVVVGKSKLDEQMKAAMSRADKIVEKEIKADQKQLERAREGGEGGGEVGAQDPTGAVSPARRPAARRSRAPRRPPFEQVQAPGRGAAPAGPSRRGARREARSAAHRLWRGSPGSGAGSVESISTVATSPGTSP